MSFLLLLNIVKYGGRESLTRCTLGKHMQLHKTPANKETIFINVSRGLKNMTDPAESVFFLFMSCNQYIKIN